MDCRKERWLENYDPCYYSPPYLFCNSDVAIHGWGLLSQFPPFRYFPMFSVLSKHTLAIEYHVYIWRCHRSSAVKYVIQKYYRYFFKIQNFIKTEINEQNFINPYPALQSHTESDQLS